MDSETEELLVEVLAQIVNDLAEIKAALIKPKKTRKPRVKVESYFDLINEVQERSGVAPKVSKPADDTFLVDGYKLTPSAVASIMHYSENFPDASPEEIGEVMGAPVTAIHMARVLAEKAVEGHNDQA